jgi:hypothetical protein
MRVKSEEEAERTLTTAASVSASAAWGKYFDFEFFPQNGF